MASTLSNIQEGSEKRQEKHLIKRRRIDTVDQHPATTTTTTTTTTSVPWRSQTEQQTYSCKLLHALRHLRGQTNPCSAPLRGRAVREEADEVLAAVARGRSRWSRAILAKRMKLRIKNHKKVGVKSKWVSATGNSRLRGAGVRERRNKLPAVDKRVKVLGRLVPGCREVSFPNLLEEAIDYIGAVQMQVRAMTALAELLTASQISSNGNEPGSNG